MSLWPHDHEIIWSYCHMIIWSYDHMIIWSCSHTIIRLNDHMIIQIYNELQIVDHLFVDCFENHLDAANRQDWCIHHFLHCSCIIECDRWNFANAYTNLNTRLVAHMVGQNIWKYENTKILLLFGNKRIMNGCWFSWFGWLGLVSLGSAEQKQQTQLCLKQHMY